MAIFGKTNCGIMRNENQDSFQIFNCGYYRCAVVCDGMGGAKGGKVASEMAVKSYVSRLNEKLSEVDVFTEEAIKDAMEGAINYANDIVFSKACKKVSLEGMGTTLVAMILDTENDIVYISNVGDSRCYGIKNGVMSRITKDQSYVQTLLDACTITEEEAMLHPMRNVILQAVGLGDKLEVDFYKTSAPDAILLCSDGLTNYATEDMLEAIINDASMHPEEKLDKMIKAANNGGGGDNITAVVYFRD